MEEHFYQKTWFKNTVLIGIPTIISTIGVIISYVDGVLKGFLIATSVILFIVFAILVIVFSNMEDKKGKEIENLKHEIDIRAAETIELKALFLHMENNYQTSLYTISSLSSMFEIWSKNINSFASNIKRNGEVSDKAWDKVRLMDTICKNCKSMIQKYCNDFDDSKVSVGFISYRKDDNGKEWVHMISHSNPGSTRPSSAKEEVELSQCLYHYGDLIKRKATDIELAMNNNEILHIFNRVSTTCDLSKYTQYIAIPVYCTSNKLLGIFQVVTKYDYKIEEDGKDLRTFVTSHIIPYSNLIVLVDKIYKGLYINPIIINKED